MKNLLSPYRYRSSLPTMFNLKITGMVAALALVDMASTGGAVSALVFASAALGSTGNYLTAREEMALDIKAAERKEEPPPAPEAEAQAVPSANARKHMFDFIPAPQTEIIAQTGLQNISSPATGRDFITRSVPRHRRLRTNSGPVHPPAREMRAEVTAAPG